MSATTFQITATDRAEYDTLMAQVGWGDLKDPVVVEKRSAFVKSASGRHDLKHLSDLTASEWGAVLVGLRAFAGSKGSVAAQVLMGGFKLKERDKPAPYKTDGAKHLGAADKDWKQYEGRVKNTEATHVGPHVGGAVRDNLRDAGEGPHAAAQAHGSETLEPAGGVRLSPGPDGRGQGTDAPRTGEEGREPGLPAGRGGHALQGAGLLTQSLSGSLSPLSQEAPASQDIACGSGASGKTFGASTRKPLPLVTTSRLKTFRRCPREHEIAYEQGIRPAVESEAARFGSLYHKVMEGYFYAIKAGGDPLKNALTVLSSEAGRQDRDGRFVADPFDIAKVRSLLLGYDARWHAEPYEVLEVEVEFRAPLVNPDTGAKSKTYERGGKIDVIVRDKRDGRILVMDHKTTSEDVSPGSDYWKRTRMDSQVGAYYLGARTLGYEVSGWIHDVIVKPGLRPLKANKQRDVAETPDEYGLRIAEAIAENPDKFFAREEVVRLEAELLEYERDVWSQTTIMRDLKRQGLAPRNPDACQRYGSYCSYWPVCSGQASLDDPLLYRKSAWLHPELTPPNETNEEVK